MPGGGDSLTIVFVLLALVSWLLPALLKAGKNQAGNKRLAEPRQPRPDNLRAQPWQTRRDYVRPEPGTLEPPNPQLPFQGFRGARGGRRNEESGEPADLSILFRELLGVDEAGVSAPPPVPEVRRAIASPPKAPAAPPAEAPAPGTRLVFSDHPVVQGIIFSELLAPPLCERPYDR